MASQYEGFSVEHDGDVVRIWLDRPHKHNALDTRIIWDLGTVFGSLDQYPGARVMVLGGRGPSFSSGADRRVDRPQPTADSPVEARRLAHAGRRMCRALEESDLVTVARVHGHAIGGGCCLALSCDFRIASDDVSFLVPEVELGVPLTWAAVPRLIREVGAARARQIVMMCEPVLAPEALAWNLVHEVTTVDGLDAAVDRWVDRLVGFSDLAVHQTKTTFRAYDRMGVLGDVSEADGDLITLAQQTDRARASFGR